MLGTGKKTWGTYLVYYWDPTFFRERCRTSHLPRVWLSWTIMPVHKKTWQAFRRRTRRKVLRIEANCLDAVFKAGFFQVLKSCHLWTFLGRNLKTYHRNPWHVSAGFRDANVWGSESREVLPLKLLILGRPTQLHSLTSECNMFRLKAWQKIRGTEGFGVFSRHVESCCPCTFGHLVWNSRPFFQHNWLCHCGSRSKPAIYGYGVLWSWAISRKVRDVDSPFPSIFLPFCYLHRPKLQGD